MLNSHYDDDPLRYSARRSGWLNQRRQRRAIDFLGAAQAGDTVLDLGSGTGDLTLSIAVARPDLMVMGVEPLDSYVVFARERAAEQGVANVEFARGFAEDLSAVLPAGSVDWVVSSDVLHHVSDEQATIDSVARACSPGASWLAIEPNPWNPYMFLFCALTDGERNFRPNRFTRLATATHFRLVGTERLFLIPSAISDPKPGLKWLEERFEGWRVLGGGVALRLIRTTH